MKIHLFALLGFVLLVEIGFAQELPAQNFLQRPQPAEVPPRIDIQVPFQNENQSQNPNWDRNLTLVPNATVLTKAHLRDIDTLVRKLADFSKELHDEFHEHLEGVRHAQKLDEEVTALERLSESLHEFAINTDGSAQSVTKFRSGTNEFIQLAVRISRTIDLTEPWLRGNDARVGTRHMRIVARSVLGTALRIDSYLPVDTQVIDNQAERLETAIKELHDEFHEHLEGYEVSRHLDEDLESVETLVEHMHELSHDKAWGQIDFNHLSQDIVEVREKTAHIESLFIRQAEIGVRTRDWIGIEHARDAITDVLSSAYLLDHMIQKTQPVRNNTLHRRPIELDPRPLRDRHGHPVNPIRDPYWNSHRLHSNGIR